MKDCDFDFLETDYGKKDTGGAGNVNGEPEIH